MFILGSCMELKLNYNGCCDYSKTQSCVHIDCRCDQWCYNFNECCDDIDKISCFPPFHTPVVTPTPTDTFGKTESDDHQCISHNVYKIYRRQPYFSTTI